MNFLNTISRSILKSIFIIIFISTIAGNAKVVSGFTAFPIQGTEQPSVSSVDESVVYLPLIIQPDRFSSIGIPIWVEESETLSHEVGLFRQRFTLSHSKHSVELQIFADTRYEVFLDGVWLGRGPARFSDSIHEYDVYSIGNLQPGEHVIAVIVQWAPNIRRSESQMPYIQANLRSKSGNSGVLLVTDQTWKAKRSDAWNSSAVPVHSWGLIGPTELLDLRKLPQNWTLASYDDSVWSKAVPAMEESIFTSVTIPRLDPNLYTSFEPSSMTYQSSVERETESNETIRYQARSIELLENYPITVTLLEVGLLSPGREIIELSGNEINYQIGFEVSDTTSFSVEGLTGENTELPSTIKLDNETINFNAAGYLRPDVMVATRTINLGQHTLTIQGIPPDGATLGISADNITFHTTLPFHQGTHAGRRLLLADYIPSSSFELTMGTEINFGLPASGYAVIDLGRTIHGRAEMELEGAMGTVVDLGWDERIYLDSNRPLPFPGSLHPQWNQVDSWILDGTTRTITTIDDRAGRYLLLAVWGDEPVNVVLRVKEERYPVEQLGSFESSNDLLNQIWQMGVETSYPNMTDAYADPWRERGQWWGDAYVIDRVNQVVFNDNLLLRRGLLFMADGFIDGRPEAMAPNGSGLHMVDYAMLWVHALQQYLERSGDLEFTRVMFPTLVEFLEYIKGLEDPTTQLIDLPEDVWALTAYIDTLALNARKGQSVPINALYAETFLRAAFIAEALGNQSQADTWKNRAEFVKLQTNNLLYLPEQRQYLTSIYQGQLVPPTLYAQAWPLAYGMVPDGEDESIKESLLKMLSSDPTDPNIGIYGMFWILEGLGRYGYIDDAIQIIETYYGWMLSEGATTWWEHFEANKNYTAALSHGWGSSPTWFLTTYVLGASQTSPKSWKIKPAFSGVEFVSGNLPLSQGNLYVQWSGMECLDREVIVDAPTGTTGEIIVELQPDLTLKLNSLIVWQGKPLEDFVHNSDTEIFIHLESGDHVLQIEQICTP